MDAYVDQLMNPPFAKDPPVKLNVPAKTLGLVCAILGGIAALFGLFALFALLGLSGVATLTGFGGIWFLVIVGSLVSEAGTVLAAWGGYKMYQGDHSAKKPVVLGLAITVVGGLITALGSFGGGLPGWILSTAVTFAIYYLVIISRFSDET